MEIKDLLAAATDEELPVLAAVIKRLNDRPAILVTVGRGGSRRRHYVVVEDEEAIRPYVGKSHAELAKLRRGPNGMTPIGCQWLRAYGKVDELYVSLSLDDVVKVEETDRAKVWGTPPTGEPDLASEPDLAGQLKAGWQRYHTTQRELVALTLRDVVRQVRELVPEAASLHLAIRYPDKVGAPDRWLIDHVEGACNHRIQLAAAVERELENVLHEPLADLAELGEVTDTGRIDLVTDLSTLVGSDPLPRRLG
jgi:hypothetical protein